MGIKIIRDKISIRELKQQLGEGFGDMVKAVVDIGRGIMAIGGELHSDAEAVLLEEGSRQEDLWGINLYPEKFGNEWIEYSSLTNIRPRQGNRSMEIENPQIKEEVDKTIKKLVIPE